MRKWMHDGMEYGREKGTKLWVCPQGSLQAPFLLLWLNYCKPPVTEGYAQLDATLQ